MTEGEEIVARLRDRGRKLDEDQWEPFADEISVDYLEAAAAIESLQAEVARLRTPTATPSDVEKAYREGYDDGWCAGTAGMPSWTCDPDWELSESRAAISAIEGEKK
jgi:hypothetical protein